MASALIISSGSVELHFPFILLPDDNIGKVHEDMDLLAKLQEIRYGGALAKVKWKVMNSVWHL